VKCVSRVQAGVCGFSTAITAEAPDEQMVTFQIETDCPRISGLAEALQGSQVDAYQEIGAGFDGVVLTAVRSSLSGCCAGCVVPAALFKSLQVAARLALPRDIAIEIKAE